jgi:hypothetical protein
MNWYYPLMLDSEKIVRVKIDYFFTIDRRGFFHGKERANI